MSIYAVSVQRSRTELQSVGSGLSAPAPAPAPASLPATASPTPARRPRLTTTATTMEGNSQDFKTAATKVKSLKTQPSNEELLHLYSLYKQATVGDVNIPCPSVTDMKGKAKWDAWNERKGISKADADAQYIDIANKLIAQYGTK